MSRSLPEKSSGVNEDFGVARLMLKEVEGQRFRCRAKISYVGKTLLLINVTDAIAGDILTDHLWFTSGKWSNGLKRGDEIEFDARVSRYVKKSGIRDWRLERPTKVVRINSV